MIPEKVLQGFLELIAFLIALLPADTVDWPDGEDFGTFAGSVIGPLDALLPVAEMVAAMTVSVTIIMPGLIAYRVALWIWGALPFV